MTIVQPTPEQTALTQEQYDLEQSAQQALDVNDYTKAEDLARQSCALGIGSVNGESILAEALYLDGKFDEALKVYVTIVEQQKGDQARWLFPYALLELRAGNWAKAVNAYNHCLDPRPDDLMYMHSSFDPAIPNPDDLATALHIALGLTYSGRGKNVLDERALSEYTKALAIEPNSTLAQLYYAHGLFSVGRKNEALTEFKKVSDSTTGDIKADADATLNRYPAAVNTYAPVSATTSVKN